MLLRPITEAAMPHDAVAQLQSALSIAERLTVPDGQRFAALQLRYDSTGAVSFEVEPLHAICAASAVDPAVFFNAQGCVMILIAAWYGHATARGEPGDAVMEDLLNEWGVAQLHGSQPRYVGTA